MKKLLIAGIIILFLIGLGSFVFFNINRESRLKKETGKSAKNSDQKKEESYNIKVGKVGVDLPVAYQVAINNGLFKKYNLNIDAVEVQGGAVEALISNKIDFLMTRPIVALNAKRRGSDILWIATLEKAYSYTFFSKVPKEKIKKVGIVRAGGSDNYVTLAALFILGIDPKKVELIQTGNDVGKVTLFKKEELDAAGLNISSIQRSGKEIPPVYNALINIEDTPEGYIPEGVFVTEKYLKNNPQIAENYLKAVIEGTIWAQKNSEKTIELLMKNLEISKEEAQNIYEGFLKVTKDIDFTANDDLFKTSLKLSKYQNTKEGDIEIDTFYDNTTIDFLTNSGFIKNLSE